MALMQHLKCSLSQLCEYIHHLLTSSTGVRAVSERPHCARDADTRSPHVLRQESQVVWLETQI